MSHRPARLLVLLALLAVLTGGCAGTDGAAPDGRYSLSVVTENEHRFAAGEVSVGPLVIAGGDTTLEEGSEHHGTVAVLAGDLTLDGTLDGDLLVLGGAVRLGGKGVVTGDVQRAGGSLERAEGATVRGREQDQADPADLVGEPTAVPRWRVAWCGSPSPRSSWPAWPGCWCASPRARPGASRRRRRRTRSSREPWGPSSS